MKKLLIAALGLLCFVTAAGAAFIQAGLVDIAADTPHPPIVSTLIEWARERAIERHTRNIQPPADLADASRIRRGAGNYDAMCVACHRSPGAGESEIQKGLYPKPPDLSLPTQNSADARRFWIIKHGIKASAMPAWSKGGMEDAAIWDLAAFLKALPSLSPEQYGQLVASSDGHNHHGIAPAPTQQPPTPERAGREETKTPVHKQHDSHDHKH